MIGGVTRQMLPHLPWVPHLQIYKDLHWNSKSQLIERDTQELQGIIRQANLKSS